MISELEGELCRETGNVRIPKPSILLLLEWWGRRAGDNLPVLALPFESPFALIPELKVGAVLRL